MNKYFPLRSFADSKINFAYQAKSNAGKPHCGLDLDCTDIYEMRNGLPDIIAPVAGVVYKSGYDADGWGFYVTIKGNDGLFYILAHMSNICVRIGYKLNGCEKIGVMGNTGNSTGSHLHFEIRSVYADRTSHADPAAWLGIENKKGAVKWIN